MAVPRLMDHSYKCCGCRAFGLSRTSAVASGPSSKTTPASVVTRTDDGISVKITTALAIKTKGKQRSDKSNGSSNMSRASGGSNW